MENRKPAELSIIIPVYNEKRTLRAILDKVRALDLSKQIIVVDNCSTDGTREILQGEKGIDKLILQKVNLGKGNSVRTAIPFLEGEYSVIQDGDLEYDPRSFHDLLKKAREENLDAVYGSRVLGGKTTRYQSYYMGVRMLTWATNLLYGARLTDAATTYKMVRTEVLKRLPLRCYGFDLDFELTNKLCKYSKGIREVPIPYSPRTFAEGKKIRSRDGLIALWVILKNRFID